MTRFEATTPVQAPAIGAGTPPPALTVYYDGACPVCSREIAVYRRQPGADRCAWVDASRCDEAELGVGLSRAQALARLHVRAADGSLRAGVQGFAAMWSALPRTALLGRVAGWAPVAALLELAYSAFLRVRPVWRSAPGQTAAQATWPPAVLADLRSDHAGEVGAVHIYRGILAVTPDPGLRAFAARHMQTEMQHLDCVQRHLPRSAHSRLLPIWRVAGWLTGALPALVGPRAVYTTVAAVETFVDRHYAAQIAHLDALLASTAQVEGDAVPAGTPPGPRPLADIPALRRDLAACREDELQHRDEARAAAQAGANGGRAPRPAAVLARAWVAAVASGSAFAVKLARRF